MSTQAVKRLLVGLYIVSAIWWLSIFLRGIQNTTENYCAAIMMSFIPFLAGGYSVFKCKNRSSALFWISGGLISWGIGNAIFGYYNLILHNPVPYPSLADVFYLIAFIAWLMGMIKLHTQKKLYSTYSALRLSLGLFLSCILVIALYIIVLFGNKIELHFTLESFFRLVYPIFDIIFFVLAARTLYEILFFKLKNVKHLIYIMIGFVLNYFADFAFSYTTQHDTYFVANWVDFLFLSAIFFIGYGLLNYEE